MNGVDQIAHSRVQAAQDRLARAMERLESVLQKRAEDTLTAPGAAQSSAEDESRLRSEVQQLQSENAELRTLVETAAERLDVTIAKFKDKLAG